MARYRHYNSRQAKMIAVSYDRQLLPGTFEHALSHLIDHEINLGRFNNDNTGAPAYDSAVLLKIVLFAYSRGITSSRTMARRAWRTCSSSRSRAISSRISRRWRTSWRRWARKWRRCSATC